MLTALALAGACDATSAKPGFQDKDRDAAPDAALALVPDGGTTADDTWAPGVDDAPTRGTPDPARNPSLGVDFDATDLDAPPADPPSLACGADAAEAGFCPPPYSHCADERWLVFYDYAQCVSGGCTWETRYLDCGVIPGCHHGQCQPPVTM